jgi:uncharacterized membrane protein
MHRQIRISTPKKTETIKNKTVWLKFISFIGKSSEGGTTEQSSSTKSAVIGGVIAAVVIVLTAVVVIYVVWARRGRLRYYINVYLVVSIIIVLYVQSNFEL